MQRKGSAFRKKELPIPFLQNPVARSSIPVCSDRLKGPDASHKKKKKKKERIHAELSISFPVYQYLMEIRGFDRQTH